VEGANECMKNDQLRGDSRAQQGRGERTSIESQKIVKKVGQQTGASRTKAVREKRKKSRGRNSNAEEREEKLENSRITQTILTKLSPRKQGFKEPGKGEI